MEKANVAGLVRPAVVTESRTFTDSSQPGFTLPVTLTSLLGPGRMEAALRAQRYMQRYLTPPKGTEKLVVMLPDGQPWDATELGCRNIAQLEERQKSLPAGARYSDVEWMHISQTCADAFNEVLVFADELDSAMKATNLLGNPSGLPTQPASETSPASIPNTPNSPSEGTSPSAPLTSGSALPSPSPANSSPLPAPSSNGSESPPISVPISTVPGPTWSPSGQSGNPIS